MKTVLIAAAAKEICRSVGQALPEGRRYGMVDTLQDALAAARKTHPDLIFIDLEMLLEGADRKAAGERFAAFKTHCDED